MLGKKIIGAVGAGAVISSAVMGGLSPIGGALNLFSWLRSSIVFFPFSILIILSLSVPALVLLQRKNAINSISILMVGLASGEIAAAIFCLMTKFDSYWFVCMGFTGLVAAGGVQYIFRFSNKDKRW